MYQKTDHTANQETDNITSLTEKHIDYGQKDTQESSSTKMLIVPFSGHAEEWPDSAGGIINRSHFTVTNHRDARSAKGVMFEF